MQRTYTEQELISSWNGLHFRVTVCCVCFNHETFINDAINSFFQQKTSFPFKVIIYDDNSTDNSRKLIDKWKNNYPQLIEVIYADENQYSKGNRPLDFILDNVSTEFIAFCEGDDYWFSSNKLQTQFDTLENTPQSDVCFTAAYTLFDDIISKNNYGYHGKEKKIISKEKVIKVSAGLMPMASIFLRSQCLLEYKKIYPLFFRKYLRHSAIQILASERGGAVYIPEYTTVYRSMHENSWSFSNAYNFDAKFNSYIEFLNRNKYLNKITKYKYDTLFQKVSRRKLFEFISSTSFPFTIRIKFLNRLINLSDINATLKTQAFIFMFFGIAKHIVKAILSNFKRSDSANK